MKTTPSTLRSIAYTIFFNALGGAAVKRPTHPASYKGCTFIMLAIEHKKKLITTKMNTLTKNVNKISSVVKENVSFAQAALGLYLTKSMSINKPSTSATPRTERSPQSTRYTTSNSNNHIPATAPNWILDLKNEIATIVSSQYQAFAAQITANTEKIEYIFNNLFSN